MSKNNKNTQTAIETKTLAREAFIRNVAINPLPSPADIQNETFVSDLNKFANFLLQHQCDADAKFLYDLIEIAGREPQYVRLVHIYGMIVNHWDTVCDYDLTYCILSQMSQMTANNDDADTFSAMARTYAAQ